MKIKKTMRNLALKGEVCDSARFLDAQGTTDALNGAVFVKFLDINFKTNNSKFYKGCSIEKINMIPGDLYRSPDESFLLIVQLISECHFYD